MKHITSRYLHLPLCFLRRSWNHTYQRHVHDIIMPSIMDAKEGVVDKWLKKEGDEFKQGERICQVSLDGLTIGVDGPNNGYIAKILVQPNKTVPIGQILGQYTLTQEEFMTIRENMRLADQAAELQADAQEVLSEASKKPDTKVLLREIKHLIQNGDIKENSKFAKQMLSLARKGDPELLAVFEASFDGVAFDSDSFDVKFFLNNVRDLLKDNEDD